MRAKITGVGSYIPTIKKENANFTNNHFLNTDGSEFESDNSVIIEKFQTITGIAERRYAKPDYTASDLGFFAAKKAIENANIDKEELDYIIFAHNFGDVKDDAVQLDIFPGLATRVKQSLKIKNPNCVAYDMLFGCPGWIEGVIQGHAFIKAEMAKKVLVIGADTLSRVSDQHDRDAMIFSDGAGACILEATTDKETGILAHASQTYSIDEAFYLHFGSSNNKDKDQKERFIKMQGRKIYEFALSHVPNAIKSVVDKSGVSIDDIKKIFIHQANEKMDDAIAKRFYRLYKKSVPSGIMPMSIHELGNSSVATVPTLFDLVLRGKIENQEVNKGDVIIFASVGAGMHINAIVYRY